MKSRHTKPTVVVIVGPTGVGKTSLSIKLAQHFRGEILSADSRQVYQNLDIGTEKVSKRDMRGIPHHLIDICPPKKVFTADDFRRLGTNAIKEIFSRGNVPMIVGGTGFYISSLLNGQHTPLVPANPVLRTKLEKLSAAKLFTLLKSKDPARAKTIDANNPRRLVRALEIVATLGKVPTLKEVESPFDILWIGILPGKLYERDLKSRLEKQLKRGLLAEIKSLLKRGISKKRLREFGLEYRTGLQFIDGELSKTEMKAKMLIELRQYSKRQMTWFKRDQKIKWFHSPADVNEIRQILSRFIVAK